jgi:hypothetical protein
MDEISLLNSMPQLESLYLDANHFDGELHGDFRLNLNELKTLYINYNSKNILEIFDHLPDDVLRSVLFYGVKAEPARKYFSNQRKLDHLYLVSSTFNPLEMNQLQLSKLNTDCRGEELRSMLEGQCLFSLCVHSEISQSDFNFICGFNSINELYLTFLQGKFDFSKLEHLKQLKKLQIVAWDEADLQSVKSDSVEKLCLGLFIDDPLSRESAVALSSNCPNLVNLEIKTDDIDVCLKYMSQLKTFKCNRILDTTDFSHDLDNQNLKKLELGCFNVRAGAHLLFGRVRNLEVFTTEMIIEWKELQAILTLPNLKALCLKGFPHVDEAFIWTLKNYGKNLESFHVRYNFNQSEEELYMSPRELREEFQDQFPIFSFRVGKMWTMKKSNKPFACCNN